MINGSVVCFLESWKGSWREGKRKYIFNASDKKRPLKRGYLRAISCCRSFVPPTLFPHGNKKKQLLTERRRTPLPRYTHPPQRFDRFSPVMFIQLGKRRTSYDPIPALYTFNELEEPTLNAIYRRATFPFFVSIYSNILLLYPVPISYDLFIECWLN